MVTICFWLQNGHLIKENKQSYIYRERERGRERDKGRERERGGERERADSLKYIIKRSLRKWDNLYFILVSPTLFKGTVPLLGYISQYMHTSSNIYIQQQKDETERNGNPHSLSNLQTFSLTDLLTHTCIHTYTRTHTHIQTHYS